MTSWLSITHLASYSSRNQLPISSNESIQKIRAVQGIALLGNETCVANHAAQFLFAGAMMGPGSRNHVFLDHDTAYVVASEAEPELACFQSLSDPGRLNVVEILQV